jgi:hypothetical protein
MAKHLHEPLEQPALQHDHGMDHADMVMDHSQDVGQADANSQSSDACCQVQCDCNAENCRVPVASLDPVHRLSPLAGIDFTNPSQTYQLSLVAGLYRPPSYLS